MSIYYISPTGNDTTGNGSSGNPWATLSKAVTSSAVSDTIICKSGTYTFGNQTFATGRTIQAEVSGAAIFDGASASVQWTVPNNVSLILTGLIFQNIIVPASGAILNVTFSGGWTITCTNCIFRLIQINQQTGLIGGNQSDNGGTIVLTSCLFDDITAVAGTTNTAIFLTVNSGSTKTVTITNCTFVFKTTGTSSLAAFQASFGGANVWNITMKNTIFYSTAAKSYKINSAVTNTTVTYSDFYQITSNPTGSGVITSDPLFVDASNSNYNLRPTSPCRDTGTLV